MYSRVIPANMCLSIEVELVLDHVSCSTNVVVVASFHSVTVVASFHSVEVVFSQQLPSTGVVHFLQKLPSIGLVT